MIFFCKKTFFHCHKKSWTGAGSEFGLDLDSVNTAPDSAKCLDPKNLYVQGHIRVFYHR
jgi:hypothetical protein